MSAASAMLLALGDGPNIRIDAPIMVVGRSTECDIVVDSKKVSRKHCCIALLTDYLVVRDLGSTNGIFVNGAKKEEGRLGDGDEFAIANLRYRVQWESGKNGAPESGSQRASD